MSYLRNRTGLCSTKLNVLVLENKLATVSKNIKNSFRLILALKPIALNLVSESGIFSSSSKVKIIY
jgi:hypothetical protein